MNGIFSSWAEIHAAIMGIGFGLLSAAAHRVLPARRWFPLLGFVVGLVVGLNLNVSPWEGWWHVWYVLLPTALVVYFVSR